MTFVSVNLRGLQLANKRKDVLNFLKQKKFSVYFLQDTHFTKTEEKYIRTQWGYESFFSSFSSQQRGVAILFNNNFEFKLHSQRADNFGNKLILDVTINGKRMTLINIYGPNKDSPEFYAEVKRDIENFGNNIILAGDFNLVLDPPIDSQDYVGVNNPNARNTLIDLIADCNLVDCWRELNAEKRLYTWRRPNSNKRGRLDFFLISENLFSDIEDTSILPGYRSDHSIVLLSLKLNKFEKGHSFWKFNNSLLKDKTYVDQIKTLIENIKLQYASEVQNSNQSIKDIPAKDIVFEISDQLFFEVLLMEIRGKTISYSSYLKKQADKTQENLIKDIDRLECSQNINNEELESKRKQLEDFRKKKLEGVKVRSKAKWIEEGEKVTNYFCSLENRNFVSKCMPNLISEDGILLKDQNLIINETTNFYKNLYTERPVEKCDLNNKFRYYDLPKLSVEQQGLLEGPISYEELLLCLKHAKNNRSPGSDGFTMEFYKFFWLDIGRYLLRSLNCGFNLNELSVTQKEGIITCIPKPNKDRQFLKNWRPITLLNCSYKLGSACIANRLKKVLPQLINKDQTGFLSGRYIGENIRVIYDLIYMTEKENIPGLLLLIDFEKAFDSVSWRFIDEVLSFFNFGVSFKHWIRVLYNNIKTCVQVNGHLSEWFLVQRGCRQGDPISPYIFLLCAEILAIQIRGNRNIRGIGVGDKEFVISQYADDTSLILDGTQQSLMNALLELKFYASISGLEVNAEKTKVIWIGSMRGSNIRLCQDYNLQWETGVFSLLGVNLSTDLNTITDVNYEIKLKEIETLFAAWSKRILTPLGKIIVIKNLAIPKMNHLFLSLPNPSDEFIKTLQTLCFNFLWKNGPDKIKRPVIIQNYDSGGLRMIDVNKFMNALKITWIRRMILVDKKCFAIHNYLYPFLRQHHVFGSEYINSKMDTIRNPFWRDVYKAFVNFFVLYKPRCWKDFLGQSIWFNQNIKVGKTTCFYKVWYDHGIAFVNDLIDRNGNFYSLEILQELYRFNTNFVIYEGLLAAIRKYLQSLKLSTFPSHLEQPVCPSWVCLIIQHQKGCRDIYDVLIEGNVVPTSKSKWETELTLYRGFEWNKIYKMPFLCSKDTNLQWFQYRINHRILATNSLLFKMNIKNTDVCSFCSEESETLIHLFWNCRFVQAFWRQFKSLLASKNIILARDFTLEIILLGSTKYDTVLNLLIQKAKQFIYRKKCEDNIPIFDYFKPDIRSLYQIEKYNAVKNGTCRLQIFEKLWSPYKALVIHEAV